MDNSSNRIIRVVYSTRVLPKYRVRLMELLAQDPFIELTVITTKDRSDSKALNYPGSVEFNRIELNAFRPVIRTRNSVAELSIPIGLGRALHKCNPDVVITEGASHIFGNLICFIFARIFKKKVVQWSLGALVGRKPSAVRRIADLLFFRFLEKNSDAIIAYSTQGAQYFRNIGIPKEKIEVALNTTDTMSHIKRQIEYAKKLDLPYPSPAPDKFHIVYAGALTEAKNVSLLLRAFKEVCTKISIAQLSIAGDGPLRNALETETELLGISDSVKFWGQISEEMSEFFYDATVLVMPGLGGLVIADSLAHGVPVICHKGDGTEQDIVNETCGKILPKMTDSILAHSLLELADNRKQQKYWRQGALNMAQEKLSIHNYKDSILRAIQISIKD